MKEERINSIRELLRIQEYDLAEQQLEQYLQLEPEDWDARILLGTCYMFQGNMKKAKSLYVLIQEHLKSEKSAKSSLLKQYWEIGAVLLGSTALIVVGLGYYGHRIAETFAALAQPTTAYAGPPVDYYCSVCGEKTSIGWGWIRDEKKWKELREKVDRGLIPCEKCKKDTPFVSAAQSTVKSLHNPSENNKPTW